MSESENEDIEIYLNYEEKEIEGSVSDNLQSNNQGFGPGNLGFRCSNDSNLTSITLAPGVNDSLQDAINAQSSPLGLTLTKSASFLSLLEKKLCDQQQEAVSRQDKKRPDHERPRRSRMDNTGSAPINDRLKASNFPVASIVIGRWQRCSGNEGDLIAKMYYAKKKIVWEVLDGPLKSKIEILWSEITAIKATFRDNQPGVLEIELDRPPLFFRESNPQPRKHIVWQQSSDFTGGQASCLRKHTLSFHPGVLDKHYEKLLQCDERLFGLSQEPFPSQGSPYFNTAMSYDFSGLPSILNGFGSGLPQLPQYPSWSYTTATGALSRLTPNPTAKVTDFPRLDGKARNFQFSQKQRIWDHQGVHLPRENINTQGPSFRAPAAQGSVISPPNCHKNMVSLTDVENYLLGDSQNVSSDEGTLLAEVESMGSLLEAINNVDQSQRDYQVIDPSPSQVMQNPTDDMQHSEDFCRQPTNLPDDSTPMKSEGDSIVDSFMSGDMAIGDLLSTLCHDSDVWK